MPMEETTLTEIPDHLVAEIFLRLPAAEDLARASAACVFFRRIVTEKPFLRRFRRLHAPPVLGFHDRDGFHPAVPAARALSLAGDFTFSFLPSNHFPWTVRDVRDGRVLLDRELGEVPFFTELVVCDPLHRRYVLLPPLPASMADQGTIFCEPSLIPPSEEEDGAAEETAFRVIWFVYCCKIRKLSILVFSSSTGRWRAAASQGLRDLLLAKDGESTLRYVMGRHYACGCVYWELIMKNNNSSWNELLALDTRIMELSIADHPPKDWNMGGIGIVEAGEEKLWMFRIIIDETAQDDLTFIIGGSRGVSSTQWQVQKTIPLDSEHRYCILGAAGRYLLLERTRLGSYDPSDGLLYMEYYSLDIETLQFERLWDKRRPAWPRTQMPYLYTNFPPLVSAPTV